MILLVVQSMPNGFHVLTLKPIISYLHFSDYLNPCVDVLPDWSISTHWCFVLSNSYTFTG